MKQSQHFIEATNKSLSDISNVEFLKWNDQNGPKIAHLDIFRHKGGGEEKRKRGKKEMGKIGNQKKWRKGGKLKSGKEENRNRTKDEKGIEEMWKKGKDERR